MEPAAREGRVNAYTISLAALLPLLSRRKWSILMAGLLGAILAIAIVRFLPHGFVSQGAVVLDSARAGPAGSGAASNGPATQEEILRTQEDIIRSRGLIEQVVRASHLEHAADLSPAIPVPAWVTSGGAAVVDRLRSWMATLTGGNEPGNTDDAAVGSAIEYIQKNLRLSSTEQSSVIVLQFTAGTRERSLSVLDSIINTYISDRAEAKVQRANEISRLLAQRAAAMKAEADEAQQKLESFLRQHSVPEVQGSLAASVQLSRNQEQLAAARMDLAKKQAKVDAMNRLGAGVLPEVLASRTIQRYRDSESDLVSKVARYGPSDPRRGPLNDALRSVRAEIQHETDKIAASIKSDADIAGATVKHLEAALASDAATSQASSVDGTTLNALRSDVDAKRQMYAAFQKSAADQQMQEMAQAPLARILFPAAPASARHLAMPALVLGAVFGILVSSAIVIIRNVFNATVRTALDLAIASGLPVVGSLPEIKRREIQGRAGVKAIAHVPAVSETLRGLSVALRAETQEKGEAVLITSCEGGEGKTTLAAALAETYAGDGFRVLLVEGDLRRPRLSSVLGVSPTRTLESVLAGTVPWTEAVVGCSNSGLDCLLASGKSRNPVSAINSQHLPRLIEESRALYDFVILDSPPVLRVADPLLLAQYCQHVLFIVRAGAMSPDLVTQATQRFPDADRKKVRTMLVRVSPRDIDKGDYYGGYGMTELEAA